MSDDDKLVSLLLKLEGWLEQQPEWVNLMTRSRQERREAARSVANSLLSIPKRKDTPQVGRTNRRDLTRRFFKENNP